MSNIKNLFRTIGCHTLDITQNIYRFLHLDGLCKGEPQGYMTTSYVIFKTVSASFFVLALLRLSFTIQGLIALVLCLLSIMRVAAYLGRFYGINAKIIAATGTLYLVLDYILHVFNSFDYILSLMQGTINFAWGHVGLSVGYLMILTLYTIFEFSLMWRQPSLADGVIRLAHGEDFTVQMEENTPKEP